MKHSLVPGLILLLTVACASTFSEVAVGPDETAPEVLKTATTTEKEVPVALRWVRNSAEHRAVYLQAFRAASWVVEVMAAERLPDTWAVALDGDETVIDNSLYELERALEGQSMTDESWDEWVRRKAAPPLPGVRAFLEHVHDLGGKIAIVTNRRQHHCEATEENFHLHELPFDVILCRSDTGEKEPRWRSVEDGTATAGLPALEIVMWLGDNIEDFPDLDQSLRLEADEEFAGFGSRFFVLPNPLYGSFPRNPPEHLAE
ncbi:MAG: HAD hydrolase-like protein [Acidobacteriota bacterium]|nr:HAD hydrolase-like protein [Acidobacteriota bacterium]